MTKKDYVKLAAAFSMTHPPNDAVAPNTWHAWLRVRDAIADTLASDNPRFDRDRFIQATEA